MITTTLGTLVEAEPALARLAAERLPVAIAYRVARLIKTAREEAQHFYELRNNLVREHGAPQDGGGPDDVRVLPTMDSWPVFTVKVTELAQLEVTIPVTPLELAAIADLRISAEDLIRLEPFLVEPPSAPASGPVLGAPGPVVAAPAVLPPDLAARVPGRN